MGKICYREIMMNEELLGTGKLKDSLDLLKNKTIVKNKKYKHTLNF